MLKDLSFCYGFLDYILLASPDETSHLQCLRQLFQCLAEYGMLINTNKCEFGNAYITFLGHEVSVEGIKPLPEKV